MIGYNDEADLTAYAAARGITLTQPEAVTLQLAMDYLNLLPWSGEKTDPAQAEEFPRNGETEVPAAIKQAQLVAAVIYDGGGDPMAPVGPKVLSESVAGAVAVTYSDKGGNGPVIYPQLNALVKPYLEIDGYGGTMFAVSRG